MYKTITLPLLLLFTGCEDSSRNSVGLGSATALIWRHEDYSRNSAGLGAATALIRGFMDDTAVLVGDLPKDLYQPRERAGVSSLASPGKEGSKKGHPLHPVANFGNSPQAITSVSASSQSACVQCVTNCTAVVHVAKVVTEEAQQALHWKHLILRFGLNWNSADCCLSFTACCTMLRHNFKSGLLCVCNWLHHHFMQMYGVSMVTTYSLFPSP